MRHSARISVNKVTRGLFFGSVINCDCGFFSLALPIKTHLRAERRIWHTIVGCLEQKRIRIFRKKKKVICTNRWTYDITPAEWKNNDTQKPTRRFLCSVSVSSLSLASSVLTVHVAFIQSRELNELYILGRILIILIAVRCFIGVSSLFVCRN